jgi:predicted metal-dependent hydrolase
MEGKLTKKEKDAIFRQILDECYEELKPYKLAIAKKEDIIIKSSNMKTQWGLCQREYGETIFTIRIANRLIDDGVN